MVDYDDWGSLYDDADWGWDDEDEETEEEPKKEEKEEEVNKDAEPQESFEHFLDQLREEHGKCECGAELMGFKNHSGFCPKFKAKPFQT